MRDLLGFMVWLAVFYYGVMPLVILATSKMRARPKVVPLEADALPPLVAEYVYGTANGLRGDGFVPEAYLSMPDAAPNVKTYLILLANRVAGDKATVTAMMVTPPGHPTRLGTRYVEFSTRFASGKIVVTMNSGALGSFEPLPHEIKQQTPHVQDPTRLYQMHRYILEHEAGIALDDEKVMYPEGEAVAWLEKIWRDGFEEQTKTGLLWYSGQGDVYRPTFIGAYKMTWKLLFPVVNYLKWKKFGQGDKTAARALTAVAQGKLAAVGSGSQRGR